MNHIADACRLNPEVYAQPASAAEAVSVIIRARMKGWLISGPDADGSYVTLEPPFCDRRTGCEFTPPVLRVPDVTFLLEYLRITNPLLRAVTGAGAPDHGYLPRPAQKPDLYLVDP